jgi:hypothetical protein
MRVSRSESYLGDNDTIRAHNLLAKTRYDDEIVCDLTAMLTSASAILSNES